MDNCLEMRVVPQTTSGDLFILNLMASLWDEICEEGAEFDDYTVSALDLWVELFDPEWDISIGAIRLREWNSTTLQLCINIRKDHRKPYSEHAAAAIHNWISKNVEKYSRMVAFIPSYFENVRLFAIESGWNEEGCMKDAFKKNDGLHDLYIYGKKIAEMRA